ncbi:TauD/TfdA family dioxygenase [Rhizobium leguminosarum]|uniref:TauD/TfdA dioxygenase family protein n=1 Tax=Rhizobium leguminosarum TaxID=384 RepID=UPI001C922A8D|nr:TauD/TfdA family dioxygenase [Rhizobium leguminosarum]MBY2993667.1 TauD/TfdA family dioxygenase [Rhizobium leguminosarum]MBY3061011.1 TauD/TfdA family dioxygenase [Rhizobium leguminosarum]
MLTKIRLRAVQHASNVCGDIEGFDFNDYDADDVAAVRKFWLQYGAVRFKKAGITDAQQVQFSRHFGEFVIHPKQLQEGGHPTHPEILVISNAMKDGKPSGAMGNSEATWHTDTWFYERPPAGAILRAVAVPPSGGDTYFLSTYIAYDTLPAPLKNAVDGRQIFFQNVYDKTGKLRLGKSTPKSQDFREWSGIVHPLVRTHGETGRKALYLGGTTEGAWIVGMSRDESDALLAELWDHTTNTKHIFVQQWDEGDIMMWDNRCTMHRRDSFDPASIRIMHRTTTSGERPV